MLDYIDKRITPEMAFDVVRRLCERGIDVKGYFILGFPTETTEEIDATEALSTGCGADVAMLQRDEFNFSIGLQLSDASIPYLRAALVRLMSAQYERSTAT